MLPCSRTTKGNIKDLILHEIGYGGLYVLLIYGSS